MIPFRPLRLLALALLAAAVAPAGTTAQTPLPLGDTAMGSTAGDAPAEYRVEADGPGFLTLVARAAVEADLRLLVTDADGQPLPDGRADVDAGGDLGAEQLVVQLPRAGTYRVFVESYGGTADFAVGGSFLPTQLAARDPDPDGSPGSAVALRVGESHDDTLDPPAGDVWDWFSFSLDGAGTLTVLTRTDGGDLSIRVYREGEYREPFLTADDDPEGEMGNESATFDVAAGETVYVRVGHPFDQGSALSYTLRSGFIPR